MGFRLSLLRAFRRTVHVLTRPRVVWTDPEAREIFDRGGAILISSHNSITNGPMLLAEFPDKAVPVVAKDWFEKKALRPWLQTWGCIPCDRFGLDTQWLRDAMKALHNGDNVLIFPEGRVRKDGELNEFKPGFALLAALSGAPVIPVSICGRYTPLKPARLVIGSPVRLDRAQARSAAYLSGQCGKMREAVMSNRKKYFKEDEQK